MLDEDSWTFKILEIVSWLQLLELSLDFGTWESVPKKKLPQKSLPTLQSLLLEGNLTLILYFLDFVEGNHLQHICICTDDWTSKGMPNHVHLYQFLGKFNSVWNVKHISTMGCRTMSDPEPIFDQFVGLATAIWPIMALRYLETWS